MMQATKKSPVWWVIGIIVAVLLVVVGIFLALQLRKDTAAPAEDFSQQAVSNVTLNGLVQKVEGDTITLQQLGVASTAPTIYTVKVTPQTVFTSLDNPQNIPTIADVKVDHAVDVRVREQNLSNTTVTAKEIVVF